MPVRGAYQKLPLIVPLRWLTLTLSEWLVVALSWLKKKERKKDRVREREGTEEER